MTDDIQIIREALAAGPTPGPWEHATYADQVGSVEAAGLILVQVQSIRPRDWNRRNVDAAYIAACSPDRMERLLARLEAAERLAAERAEALWKAAP